VSLKQQQPSTLKRKLVSKPEPVKKQKTPQFLSNDEVFELKPGGEEDDGDENDDDDDDDDDDEALNLSELKSNVEKISDTPDFQKFITRFAPLPRTYLMKYLDDEDIDPNGIRFDLKTSTWRAGESDVQIDGDDLIIGGIRYKGTPGLYELLFKKTPIGVNPKDISEFQDIVRRTNMYRSVITGHIKTNTKSDKYRQYIRPALTTSSVRTRAHTTPSYSGTGLLQVDDKTIKYRYFDDPNELVDRLQKLCAARKAGNNSNSLRDEIQAIEEELRELNIIE
jgi:hypothetical protein